MRKTDKKFKSFSIRVEDDVYKALRVVADGRKRSLNFICTEYLVKMLKIEGGI